MNKTLKKIISVMLVVLMCMTAAPLDGFVGLDLGLDFTASATGSSLTDQFTLGTGVYGTLKSDTGVLTISGTGAMKNYSNYSDSTASPLKGNTYIKEVVFEDGVTTVGDSAFTGCTSLKKVTLSDTVTSIGTYVFMSCSSFEEIHIGKAVKSIGASALDTGSESTPLLKTITVDSENPNYTVVNNVLYSKDMKTVVRYAPAKTETTYTFPATVNKISGHAFYGARNLKSIAIPEGVTEIYGETFYDCRNLETVTFPSTLKKIHGYNAFWGCSSLTSVTLPEGFTEIGSQTFLKCTKLKTVNLPESLTTIDGHAFSNCNALTDIKIPANVTSLGRSCAFYNCSSLTSIEIPEGITEIPYGTFEYCYALKSVTIPSTVTKIAEFAFYGCNVLETVNYNGSQTMWYNISIDDTSSSGETTGVNDKLRNATINYACKDEDKLGDNIWYKFDEETGAVSLVGSGDTYNYTSTGASPLYSSKGKIKSVTIGEGITGIGDFVFYGCSNLAELSLPSTLETIGEYSFYKHALTEITIPDSVTSIVDYAFYGEKLTKLHIGKGLTTFNPNMVGTSPITTLTVSEDNPSFTAKDNVLFNKDVTEYVYFPLGITEHTIPGTITTLPEGAFGYKTKLEKITIPASITIIPKRAFMYCTALKEVTISASTTEIQSYAFYEDTDLTDVYYGGTKMQWKKVQISSNNAPLTSATIHYTNPESQKLGDNVYYEIDEATGEVLIYGSGDMWDFDAATTHTSPFKKNTEIKSVKIEEGVTSIGKELFGSATNLASVTLPSSLKTIGDWSFESCSSLKQITFPEKLETIGENAFGGSGLSGSVSIPASVTSIGEFAFHFCYGLSAINVDKNNTAYSSVDGVLFDKAQETLIYYPGGARTETEYTVPATVKTIGENAFLGSRCKLEKITLQEGVETISEYGFGACTNLKDVYLPKSLTKVDNYAFDNCISLKNVYYSGTPTQWSALSIGSDNDYLTSATIHYDISLDRDNGDDAWFTYDETTGAVVISGKGETANFYEGFNELEIKSVEVGNEITCIGNEMFKDHTELTTVVLGEKIERIAKLAFHNTGIETLSIPDSVESFGSDAFSACANLKSIEIGKGLEKLSSNMFADLPSLEKITVDEENTYLSADNDVALIFDGKESGVCLVVYAVASTATEYTVPNGVDIIYNKSFKDAKNLQKVTLSDRVAYIGDETFSGCTNLTEIVLSSAIDEIGTDAFKDTALTDVYYNGTQSMWEATGITADQINNATVHYLYSADNKIGDNVYYKLDETTGTLSIVGTGAIYDYDNEEAAASPSPFLNNNSVKSVTIAEGVTRIGNNLFYGCANLASVTFPTYSLGTIGEYAFYHNTALTNVDLPISVTKIEDGAFLDAGLETVTFGEYLETISGHAFEGCKLTSVTIPDSVTLINSYAFASMETLETVHIGKGLSQISSRYAFNNSTGVKTLTISEENENFTVVDNVLFNKDKTELVYYPAGLEATEYTVPNTVTTISDNAFAYSKLENVTVQTGVTEINDDAFQFCENLKTITLPSSLTHIHKYAFQGTSNLTDVYYANPAEKWSEIEIDNGNDGLDFATFHYIEKGSLAADDKVVYELNFETGELKITGEGRTYAYSNSPFAENSSYVKSVTIGEGVTKIGYCLFRNCTNLGMVELPSTLEEIQMAAFSGCTSLLSVDIPDNVTWIWESAFSGCTSLESVTLGSKLERIDKCAFNKTAITSITIPDSVKTISYEKTFANCENLTTVVIGSGLTGWIEPETFENSNNISTITVSEDNKSLVAIDNVVYNADKTTLYYYAPTKDTEYYVIDENVTNIYQKAFANATALKRVAIPAGVTSIYSDTFSGTSLETVYYLGTQDMWDEMRISDTAVKSATVVCAYDGRIGDNVFYKFDETMGLLYIAGKGETYDYTGDMSNDPGFYKNCGDIKNIIVDEGVTAIGNCLLYGLVMAEGVTLPSTLKKIGDEAFSGSFVGIVSVDIPAGVESIGKGAFSQCFGLSAINVNEDNANYSSVDGVLFDKDKTTIIAYPNNKSAETYTIPETVKTISSYAFINNANEGKIKTINIPNSVTKIEDSAIVFVNTSLTINYEGTQTMWNNIEKVDNSLTGTDITINYLYSDDNKLGDNIYYSINSETGELSLIGTGVTYDYTGPYDTNPNLSPLYENEDITSIKIGEGITGIGNYVFNYCDEVKSVTFPKSLKSIGDYAFRGCLDIQSLELPDGLEKIGKGAFYMNNYITSVDIPDSVTEIGNYAFDSWNELTSINVGEDNENYLSLGGVLFNKDKTTLILYPRAKSDSTYVVPETVTTIFDNAFFGTKNLKRVELHNTKVETIGISAFMSNGTGTDSIQTITLPSTLKTIDDYAFANCYALTDVYFYSSYVEWNKVSIGSRDNGMLTGKDADVYGFTPATIHYIAKIGDNVVAEFDSETGVLAITGTGRMYNYDNFSEDLESSPFYNDTSIKSVTIEKGVTSIGDYLFDGCSNLAEITIPDSIDTIGGSSFRGTGLTSVVIPDSVKTIGGFAFCRCSKLESVEIGSGVQTIGYNAFSMANAIKTITVSEDNQSFSSADNVLFDKDKTLLYRYAPVQDAATYTIPATVKEIGNLAFAYATNLTTITATDGLEEISDNAFRNCESLTTLYLPSTLTYIGMGVCESTSLSDIYYNGSNVQWNAIDIQTDNGPLTDATIHYAYYQIGDNVTATFDEETGVVTITGTGKTYDYDTGDNRSPFYNDTSIKSVVVSDGVTSLGAFMFFGDSNLESVSLPDSFETLGAIPFAYCQKFKTITVGENNENFKVVDAVMFNKDMTQLVLYPTGLTATEYTTPEGLEQINSYAFLCADNLEKVTISKNVTMIDEGAFGLCSNLKTVSLPSTISRVKSYAFDDCPLTDIYFEMTEDEASKISFAPGNDEIYGATFHFAYDGKLGDNVYYKLDSETGKVTITGSGDMYDYEYNGSPFYENSDIKSVTIGEGVTSVGNWAFYGCSNLATVTFPTTLTKINESAFRFCGLTSVTIPGSVETIGESAFSNCYSLTTVTISNGVKTIGNSAFGACKGLTSLTIPGSVKTIGNSAFQYCSKLTSLTIPGSVETIGGSAFESSGLTTLTISDGIKTIGDHAFSSCELTSLTIPGSVETIGEEAFSFCNKLATVTISNGVKTIGDYAFSGCNALTSITVDENNENYASVDGVLFNKDKTTLICYPVAKADESYLVPAGVTTISAKAFMCSENIKSVTMTNDVTTLGSEALSNCSKLENVTLSNKIEVIPDFAFQYDHALTSIVIPEGVKEIGNKVFYECKALKTVTLPHSLEKVGDQAFAYFDGLLHGYPTLDVETVYYNACAGQDVDFANITFGENNECIKNADVIYIADHDFVVQHKDATCTENGYNCKQCSLCGLYYAADADVKSIDGEDGTSTFVVVRATGHDFDDVVNTKDASCTEDGVSTAYKQCKNCKKYFDTAADVKSTDGADDNSAYVITATGHDYTGAMKNNGDGTHSYKCVNGCGTYGKATAHTWDGGKETTAATHLKEGVMTYTCACGETKTEPISKLKDHTYVPGTPVPATCTQEGYTVYTCACGDSYKGDKVPATGHTWDSGKVTTAATHLKEGVMTYTCACGETKTEPISKLKDHTYVPGTPVPATCTQEGYTVYTCACGDSYKGDKVPATGHTWDSGKVTTTATHLKEGVMTYTCACGETKTEPIAKLTAHTWDSGKVTTPATHLKEGVMTYTCACGETKTEPIAKLTAHTWDSGKVTTAATHLKEGVMTYTCACGETKTEPISKLKDHTYVPGTPVPATCTQEGYTVYTCACGDSYKGDKVPATGHTWDSGKVTTAATHLKEGVMTYTCACGETKTEPIAKLTQHAYTDTVVAPTCTEQGYTKHACACGDTYTDTYVDATGHNYENGSCTSCGTADPDYNPSADCDCMCHNSSKFVQFFYKIIRWFWKIFKIHKTCDCGVAHY